MHVRRKVRAALRQHVQESERASLEADLTKAGLEGAVRVAAEIPPPAKVPSIDNEVGDNLKRNIPTSYDYNPKALKPLAETLWALSIALGHAMTAHRKFTKLKSSTISPDGMLGGRGYVMSVKDIRNALYEACEAISAVSDTIHDEIHAPHWRPKLSELEQQDKDSVERLVGDAHENLDNPESDIEEQMQDAEMTGSPVDLSSGSEDSGLEDSGLAEQALEDQGIEDPEDQAMERPELEGDMPQDEGDSFLSEEEQASFDSLESEDSNGWDAESTEDDSLEDGISDEELPEDEAQPMEDSTEGGELSEETSEITNEELPEGEEDSDQSDAWDEELPEGDEELPEGDEELPEGEEDPEVLDQSDAWGDEELPEGDEELPEGDEDTALENADPFEDEPEGKPTDATEETEDLGTEEEVVDESEAAESERFDNSGGPEEVAALEDEDLEGEDEDLEGEDEDEDEEESDEDEPMSALPGTPDAVKGKGKLKKKPRKLAASILARFGNSSLPVQTLPGPRVQHLDRADQDQIGPFGSYNSNEPHSDYDEWSRNEGTGKKVATSAMPDKSSDPTPTEGWDFGIGYGKGNDAHGQGAGGYSNPTSTGKGVYGPASGLPHPPGEDHKDVSTQKIELETSRSNRQADRWKAYSKLPNDDQGGPARSDYYKGNKPSNMSNTVRGESEVPGDSKNDYTHSIDLSPGSGYRFEQGAQPYTKWDSTTRNMKVDDINQRDMEGPYVRKG